MSPLLRHLASLLTTVVVTSALPLAAQDAPYREPFRPQYHFTPAKNWMNDPNGLVWFAGEWHLFYQYNPFGDRWGHMSWGHAVSRDLVQWEHLPVAIPERGDEMAFSGSVVVDWKNTSGFGRGGQPPLVAIYTAHDEKRKHQAQALAYSTDKGRTWTRYARNPVLDIGESDFRDPKVFWYEPQQKWVMVTVLSPRHLVRFYGSSDLKTWTPLSDFGPAGSIGGIWECPDLFELRVEGSPGESRWVLIVNLNPGAPAGGSGTQYFVGNFDGTRFVPDSTGTAGPSSDPWSGALWADWGADFYAGVSFSDVPASDGRRIWLGWMNNWSYAQDIPTTPWRSAQTIPRTLALRRTPQGVRLVQRPVVELQRLRGTRRRLTTLRIADTTIALSGRGVSGQAMELVADFDVGTAREVGLKVLVGGNAETIIGVDTRAGELYVDRTRSGASAFHKDFATRHRAPLPIVRGRVRLHVFIDWSSIEVFAADGRVVFTEQIFPDAANDGISLFAAGGTARLVSLDAWPLRSAWTAASAGRRSLEPTP